MQKIMDVLEGQALEKEHKTLEGFYESVSNRVSGITDPRGRQRIILELYDKFFKIAFPSMVARLGIVYTPVEIVDFIVKSADAALQMHFEMRLADAGVHILDPFTGTGTFPVRLIESGLISTEKLIFKYQHELHANELVLLAYYIAAINIEEAFHRISGQSYQPFPGIVLTDTFQLGEAQQGDIETGMPENHERVEAQKKTEIRVIVGNPPYSVGQDSGNDNNQNAPYPKLDERIRVTYAAHSTAQNRNSLYDSYIRAFRWASDRIGNEGVVCYVTNGGWIDGNTMDGFRKVLQDEFAHVYVFNLRGNQRTSGELSRREGGKVFGSGSRAPIAITLLVKKKDHTGKAVVHYHDIGDYLSREQKLEIIQQFASFQHVPWQTLEPNEHHDWINQRSEVFLTFTPLSDGANAIFTLRSRGVATARDSWVFNASRSALESNIRRMIDNYNHQVALHGEECRAAGSAAEAYQLAMNLADPNRRNIKWTRGLLTDLSRARTCDFEPVSIRLAMYRPFSKKWVYFNRRLNDMFYQMHKFYPSSEHKNLVIHVIGPGAGREFTCLMEDLLPDLHTISTGQCFPLFWYEEAIGQGGQAQLDLGGGHGADEHVGGYVKRDGITDAALANFRSHYPDATIAKEDIFYYCYGVLHSPDYRERFADDLRRVLPRIPYAQDFRGFEEAGRKLAKLHLKYETVAPWPVTEDATPQGGNNDFEYYRVEKMRFGRLGGRARDRSVIIV